jgi:hypothetical protein
MNIMKTITILFSMLFFTLNSSSQQANNKEPEQVTERDRLGFQGNVTYVQQLYFNIDTLNETSGVRKLRTRKILTFDNTGNVLSQKELVYSLATPEGSEENSEKISLEPWLPDQTIKFRSEHFHDTLIVLNENEEKSTYLFDAKGNLKSYIRYNGNDIMVNIELVWDDFGNWTNLSLMTLDELGEIGHVSYERLIGYSDKKPTIDKIPFITINGIDLLGKVKRNIIDYYVLLTSAGNQPWLENGKFDLKNGYFEFSAEGGMDKTIGQLALFKGADGLDIIAYNSYRMTPATYMYYWGERPKFYILQNLRFTDITDRIFPALEKSSFYPEGFKGNTDQIHTYYVLPQYGMNIKYVVDTSLGDFCSKMKQEPQESENLKEACESYSRLLKKEINISFDKSSAKFRVRK